MFTLDTGESTDRLHDMIPDWFWDTYGHNQPPLEKAVHDYGYHLIGALNNPKKMDTVRRHTMANWAFLQMLAEKHPGVFDEFWCGYAERVLGT